MKEEEEENENDLVVMGENPAARRPNRYSAKYKRKYQQRVGPH
jgi:hypothetical protein